MHAIKDQLIDTTYHIDDEVVLSNKGVPQGAVLSPTLFNIYINPLLRRLSDARIKTLAFADDIAAITHGELELRRCINIVNKWSDEFQIHLNKQKS